jgi:hypothetical protein
MSVDAPDRDPVRVASVPSQHPYVENLIPHSAAAGVVRLPDPIRPGAPAGQWWPPVMLDAEWIGRNASTFDLMHVHFGTESLSTAELAAVVRRLKAEQAPLVFTVHDLVNPQLTDQRRHLEHLEVLIEGAAELLTLTAGAADEVERRWGRRPTVTPHPQLWPLDQTAPAGRRQEPLVLGTHLRDLRPNIDGVGAVSALIGAVQTLCDAGTPAVGRVHLRDVVRDVSAAARIVDLVERAGEAVTLIRSPRTSDLELAESIADLDVSVLPYRFGTHSGWAELCFDLGVPIAGAPIGFIAEQHPGEFVPAASADSLAAAVIALTEGRASRGEPNRPGSAARRALVESRRALRRVAQPEIARTHLSAYSRALDRAVVAA